MTLNNFSTTPASCFTKLQNDLSFSYFQPLIYVTSASSQGWSSETKQSLANLLDNINTISYAFKDAITYQERLVECSEFIVAQTYPKGSPLLLCGEKCNDLFIILSGSVNSYELKNFKETCEEKAMHQEMIKEFQEERAQKAEQNAVNQALLINRQSIIPAKKPRHTIRKSKNSVFLEEKRKGSKKPTEKLPAGFSLKHKLKIRSIVAFIRSKNKGSSKVNEEDVRRIMSSLPEHEQLLLEDDAVRTKYFKETVCVLALRDTWGMGDVINERCLLREYRSPVTLVASEDVKCIKIGREIFREIFAEEIIEAEKKRRFFLNFFSTANQTAIIDTLPYITKKSYKVHERIYTQGEKSKGFYFVREGGEVRLHMEIQHKTIIKGEVVIDKAQAELNDLFLPGQKRTVQKRNVVVGIISQGDFLGDEDMFLGKLMRKYTAVSSSNELLLYYISPEHYLTLLELCPEMFQILKKRAEQRNNWMEEKIKNYEFINEKAMEPTQNRPLVPPVNIPNNFQNYWSSQLFSGNESTKTEKKTSSGKLFLVKDQDLNHLSQEQTPRHFLILGDKESLELKNSEKNPTLTKFDLKSIDDDLTQIKSIEQPQSFSSNRLFEYQRNQQKDYRHRKMIKNEVTNTCSKTLSSTFKQDKDFLQTFQKSIVKQIIANKTIAGVREIESSSLPISYRKGPQYTIKSYSSIKTNITPSPYLRNDNQQQIDTEFQSHESSLQSSRLERMQSRMNRIKTTTLDDLSSQLHSTLEISKIDTSPSYRSHLSATSPRKFIDRGQSEVFLSKGYATYRPTTGNESRRTHTESSSTNITELNLLGRTKSDFRPARQNSEVRERKIEISPIKRPKPVIKTMRSVGKLKLTPKVSEYGL